MRRAEYWRNYEHYNTVNGDRDLDLTSILNKGSRCIDGNKGEGNMKRIVIWVRWRIHRT